VIRVGTSSKPGAIQYEENGEEVGYEYVCEVGRIDLLARHRKRSEWLVIELKRNQSSDTTVGQVLRYMGWVRRQLAKPGDKVRGLIIAHQADSSIQYALDSAPDVALNLYEVEFRLRAREPGVDGTRARRSPPGAKIVTDSVTGRFLPCSEFCAESRPK
jgi:hypothetical protein